MFLPLFRASLLLVALLFLAIPARAGEVYDVGRADPQREAILDAIRPAVEARMRGPVEFVVLQMRIQNDWGFVSAKPQRPGGAAIDPATTSFAKEIEMMDGLDTLALVQYKNGRWNLIDKSIGATDAWFTTWTKMYGVPRAVLGF